MFPETKSRETSGAHDQESTITVLILLSESLAILTIRIVRHATSASTNSNV